MLWSRRFFHFGISLLAWLLFLLSATVVAGNWSPAAFKWILQWVMMGHG